MMMNIVCFSSLVTAYCLFLCLLLYSVLFASVHIYKYIYRLNEIHESGFLF